MAVSMLTFLLTCAVVTNATKFRRSQGEDSFRFYAYDYSKHGQDWSMGMCASRSRQSPIDFTEPPPPTTGMIAYRYNLITNPFKLENNGRTYTIDFGKLGYGGLTHEDAWYDLLNVNIHAGSEHTFMGARKPLEIHFVHKRYDGHGLVVVAVPIDTMAAGLPIFMETESNQSKSLRGGAGQPMPPPGGVPSEFDPNFNRAFQSLVRSALPPPFQATILTAGDSMPLDLNPFLEGGTFWEYAGSMSAPPCSETVTWFVRTTPILASLAQVKLFVDGVYSTTSGYGNWREVMPLNGREILVRTAVFEEPPLPNLAPAPAAPVGPCDQEVRALNVASDALTIAKNASAYIRALDARLHAEANAPGPAPMTVESLARSLHAAADVASQQAAQAISAQVAAQAQEAAIEAVKAVMVHIMPSTPAPDKVQESNRYEFCFNYTNGWKSTIGKRLDAFKVEVGITKDHGHWQMVAVDNNATDVLFPDSGWEPNLAEKRFPVCCIFTHRADSNTTAAASTFVELETATEAQEATASVHTQRNY